MDCCALPALRVLSRTRINDRLHAQVGVAVGLLGDAVAFEMPDHSTKHLRVGYMQHDRASDMPDEAFGKAYPIVMPQKQPGITQLELGIRRNRALKETHQFTSRRRGIRISSDELELVDSAIEGNGINQSLKLVQAERPAPGGKNPLFEGREDCLEDAHWFFIVVGMGFRILYSESVRRKTDNRRLWLAAGLLLAFILLSGALTQFSLAPGLRIEPTVADTPDQTFSVQERTPNPLGGRLVGWVVSVTVGLAILFFIVGILRKESRLSTLAAVVFGVGIALLLASLVRGPEELAPPVMGEGLAGEEGGIGIFDPLDPEEAVEEDPYREPASWWWSAIVMVPALIGICFVLRPYLGAGRRPRHGDTAQVAADAADALEAGESLQDVIQRCYRDMVTILEQTGSVRRRASMTPREFEDRLIRDGVDAPDVRGLTRLFELSRYAAGATSETDEVAAVEYLRRIAGALGDNS